MDSAKTPKFHAPNTIIRASAGTGKTYQLTNRYLGLLIAGVPASQMLATTFTRKAAGEILDRIVERLAEAALSESECERLTIGLKLAPQVDCTFVRQVLADFLRQLHRIRVSTLDAFFAQAARSFSLELGLEPGWGVVEELEEAALRDQAIQAVLAQEGSEQIVHLLAKGAADRKVSTLLRDTITQLYGLYRQTNKAAWHAVKAQTIPSASIVQQAVDRLTSTTTGKSKLDGTIPTDLNAFMDENWGRFLSKGIGKSISQGKPKYGTSVIPPDVASDYATLVEYAGGSLVNQLVRHNEGTYELLHVFDQHFRTIKRERRAYRFDDVTESVSRALNQLTDRQFEYRVGDGIEHLLLDEFQDTSTRQWMILRRFTERVVHEQSSRSFFCVGDVKQAIYGWRGGDAEIFDSVVDEFESIKLGEAMNHSRRSAPEVIKTVNQVFEGITKHSNLGDLEAPVRRWCEAFQPHTCESADPGWARLEVALESDSILDLTIDRIDELIGRSPNASIGVLTRKNDTVNELIYLLGCRGIPASEEGGNPLTDSAAVNVALSLLRWIDHPGDTVSSFHVASSPLRDLFDFPDNPDQWMRYAESKRCRAVLDRLRRALLVVGYDDVIRGWSEMLIPEMSQREAIRFEQLVKLATMWRRRHTLRPTDFVRYVENQRVADPSSAPVRVMTIHQSKGLEFDVVVLPDLQGDIVGQAPPVVYHRPRPGHDPDGVIRFANQSLRAHLPKKVQGWFEHTQSRTVSESLCVLYVAMTRARHGLLMLIPPNENEKSLPKKTQGLLRAALCEGAVAMPGRVMFQLGAIPWESEPSHDEMMDSTRREETRTQLAPPPMQRPSRPLASPSGRELVRPSSLEGGRRTDLALAIRPISRRGLQFGTVIHKWFEAIEWLDEADPSDKELIHLFHQMDPTDIPAANEKSAQQWLDQCLEFFRTSLKSDVIRRVLSHPLRGAGSLSFAASIQDDIREAGDVTLSVLNERPFLIRYDDQMLRGTIDRLVEYRRGNRLIAAEVIDFKTDAVDRSKENFDDRFAFYRPQLDAYRQAVSRWTGLSMERVIGQIVFVNPAHPRSMLVGS